MKFFIRLFFALFVLLSVNAQAKLSAEQQLAIESIQLAMKSELKASSQLQSAPKIIKRKTAKKPKITKKANVKKNHLKGMVCLGGSYKKLVQRSQKYHQSIVKYSKKYDISVSLIKAIITAESCFNERALSPKGAQGLMQLMPPTAKRFGVKNSFNADANIQGGVRYLRYLLNYFDNDLLYVIAAYNAGEGAVDKYKGIPPYDETRKYTYKVAALYELYSQGDGIISTALLARAKRKLGASIFRPRAMPRSRYSPYKNRKRNIEYGHCAKPLSTRLRKSTRSKRGNGFRQRIYVAKRGDTLMRVMQKTGVHKLKLMQMNGLSSRARLKRGQRLLVWQCRK